MHQIRSNILYLANCSEIKGGGQISLIELVQNINKDIFYPIVICPDSGRLEDILKGLGIETCIVKMNTLKSFNIFSWIDSIRKIKSIIKDKEIKLIHANGSRAAIYGCICSKSLKIPLIWHVRILSKDFFLDRILAYFSRKIVVISKAVGNRFSWVEDKKKIAIVYNGINTTKFNPNISGEGIRQRFNILKDIPLIGIIGRMDKYKGHEYFIKSAYEVKQHIPNARFLIVGSGQKKSWLKGLVEKLKLSNEMIFTGELDNIEEVIAGLDICVLSSKSEGFGRSIAEAMSSEKPVVVTNIGGLAELVEDDISGYIIAYKDYKQMAERVVELLLNKERSLKMGKEGRKRVQKYFSIEEHVKNIENLYRDIIKI